TIESQKKQTIVRVFERLFIFRLFSRVIIKDEKGELRDETPKKAGRFCLHLRDQRRILFFSSNGWFDGLLDQRLLLSKPGI
ncbi:MAG TPA: hypothetical protein VN611_05615, partial [Patescibacteria group bacterium]|nr:hypothetical protein [Patescibacteria group bacterium]